MKAFKITSDVMLIFSVILLAVSAVVASVTDNTSDAAFLALVQLNSIIISGAGVGVFLMFAKSECARKVGNGLTIASFATALVCAVSAIVLSGELEESTISSESEISIGAIVVIIAVVFLLLHYAFLIADNVLSKNNAIANPAEDIRVLRIKEWKQLLDDGIITEQEYEEKRNQILQINKTK